MNGTRDCRYFAGLYFLLRTVIFTAYIYTSSWFEQYVVQQLVCTIGILLFSIIRPYKKDFYNNVDASILGILALINALSMENMYNTAIDLPLSNWAFALQYILIFCPLLYMICYVIYKITKNNKTTLKSCLAWCWDSHKSEMSPLLHATDNVNETTTTSTRPLLDDEYRHFADEVESFGRDRERNRYKPRNTNCIASDQSTMVD